MRINILVNDTSGPFSTDGFLNKVTDTEYHYCPCNSLSHPGEGWGEVIKSGSCLISYPLILAFSRREKECPFSATR
jgi:hypothetical protein